MQRKSTQWYDQLVAQLVISLSIMLSVSIRIYFESSRITKEDFFYDNMKEILDWMAALIPSYCNKDLVQNFPDQNS